MNPENPKIAVTMGDPCGVGPEIIVKAFADNEPFKDCLPFVIGAALPLHRAVDLLGKKLKIDEISTPTEVSGASGTIFLIPAGALSEKEAVYGRPSEASSGVAVRAIEMAVSFAMAGTASAMCTCPINKAGLHRHGFPFPGHTEMIRDLTNSPAVVMMLAGPKIRVALATIHEAIADVPSLLTKDALRTAIRITGEAMVRDFGIKGPRIAVAGLNPHAGEAGRFGREEIETISPVIEEFRDNPLFRVSGPYPADTLFNRALAGEFDAEVAMYHDQGLIPVKLAHFFDAINVSLGLPIIRTSVDHGTAYDLAGTGKAHAGSLLAAIAMAAVMAKNRLK